MLLSSVFLDKTCSVFALIYFVFFVHVIGGTVSVFLVFLTGPAVRAEERPNYQRARAVLPEAPVRGNRAREVSFAAPGTARVQHRPG